MSFFVRSGKKDSNNVSTRKRNAVDKKPAKPSRKNKTARTKIDEEIASDSDSDFVEDKPAADGSASEDETETAQEKRLRLAKQYLQQLREDEEGKQEEEAGDQTLTQNLTSRLQDDVLKQAGKFHRNIAEKLKVPEPSNVIAPFVMSGGLAELVKSIPEISGSRY